MTGNKEKSSFGLWHSYTSHLACSWSCLAAGACNPLLRSLLPREQCREAPVHGCSRPGGALPWARAWSCWSITLWCTYTFPAPAPLWMGQPPLWAAGMHSGLIDSSAWMWHLTAETREFLPCCSAGTAVVQKTHSKGKKESCFLGEGARLSFKPALGAANATTYILKRFLRS